MTITEPGIGYRFLLRIDGYQLGAFTKLEGLSAKYEVREIKEGGQNTFIHSLPGRVSYTNVKLTRPVDGLSTKLASWFTSFQTQLQKQGRLDTTATTVIALNGDEQPVAQWSLSAAFPVAYTGPSFQSGSAAVLVETLELAHQGFWSDGFSPVPI
jgi:phage tail-like protein